MSNFSGPDSRPSPGDFRMNKMSFLPSRSLKVSRVSSAHKERTIIQYHHRLSPPGSKLRKCLAHRTFLGSAWGLAPVEGGKVRSRTGRVRSSPWYRPQNKLGQPHLELWNQSDPSKLSTVRPRWLSLYTSALISHWMWAAPRRGVTMGKVTLQLRHLWRLFRDSTPSSWGKNKFFTERESPWWKTASMPSIGAGGNSDEMQKSTDVYFKGGVVNNIF